MTTRGKNPKQQMVVYNPEILSRIVQVELQYVGKNINQI